MSLRKIVTASEQNELPSSVKYSKGSTLEEQILQELKPLIDSMVEISDKVSEENIVLETLTIGDLVMDVIVGNAGTRLQLKGKDGVTPAPMPYVEVAAARPGTGTDVGGALGGYQAHWIGDGATPSDQDRLYWGVELTDLTKTYHGREDLRGLAQIFVSSRNGVPLRAMTIAANGRPAMAFHGQNKNYIEILRNTGFVIDDRTWPEAGPGGIWKPLVFRREGQIAMKLEAFGASNAQPRLFMGKQGGTVASPTFNGPGEQIGAIEFGFTPQTKDNPTEENFSTASTIEGHATEQWSSTRRGSGLTFRITPTGGVQRALVAKLEEPSTNETALLIRVNKDGTKTEQKVLIGEPDSGGVGYRSLRISN